MKSQRIISCSGDQSSRETTVMFKSVSSRKTLGNSSTHIYFIESFLDSVSKCPQLEVGTSPLGYFLKDT